MMGRRRRPFRYVSRPSVVVCVLLGQTVLGVIDGEAAMLDGIVEFIVNHLDLSALDGQKLCDLRLAERLS